MKRTAMLCFLLLITTMGRTQMHQYKGYHQHLKWEIKVLSEREVQGYLTGVCSWEEKLWKKKRSVIFGPDSSFVHAELLYHDLFFPLI